MRAPVVIGGPSRNGKTNLALRMNDARSGYCGLNFELLFNVYSRRRQRLPPARLATELQDYMQRPRAVSLDRSVTVRPADALPAGDLADRARQAAAKPTLLAGLRELLDGIATAQGRETWIGADYHAEYDYLLLRRAIPDLKLVVVIRNPWESVCASLYWRQYPDRHPQAERELTKRIALWKLSLETALHLRARLPAAVSIVNANRLWRGETDSIKRLATFLSVDVALLDRLVRQSPPWFSLTSQGFTTPEDIDRPLLSAAEDRVIADRLGSLWTSFDAGELEIAPAGGCLQQYDGYAHLVHELINIRAEPQIMLPSLLRRLARKAA